MRTIPISGSAGTWHNRAGGRRGRPPDPPAGRAYQATHVIAITGNDGVNVGTAVCLHRLIHEVRRRRTRPTMCHVHLVDVHLCELLQQHGIYQEPDDLLDVHVFNVFENAARLLFARHAFEGSPSPSGARKDPQLILVGFGQMGERVALQAAKTGHYAGDRHIHVTVVDREAYLRQATFLGGILTSFQHVPPISSKATLTAPPSVTSSPKSPGIRTVLQQSLSVWTMRRRV